MTSAPVDEYMAALPADRRAAMESIRAAIRQAAPAAIEEISYRMPAFKSHGRLLVSYDAFKGHYSIFPASGVLIKALGDDLARFVSGKATIRFPVNEPLPLDLVRRIVEIRLQELDAEARG